MSSVMTIRFSVLLLSVQALRINAETLAVLSLTSFKGSSTSPKALTPSHILFAGLPNRERGDSGGALREEAEEGGAHRLGGLQPEDQGGGVREAHRQDPG